MCRIEVLNEINNQNKIWAFSVYTLIKSSNSNREKCDDQGFFHLLLWWIILSGFHWKDSLAVHARSCTSVTWGNVNSEYVSETETGTVQSFLTLSLGLNCEFWKAAFWNGPLNNYQVCIQKSLISHKHKQNSHIYSTALPWFQFLTHMLNNQGAGGGVPREKKSCCSITLPLVPEVCLLQFSK